MGGRGGVSHKFNTAVEPWYIQNAFMAVMEKGREWLSWGPMRMW